MSGSEKKVNKNTYDLSFKKHETKKFLEVSHCSRAKQRQRNVQKNLLHLQNLLSGWLDLLLFYTILYFVWTNYKYYRELRFKPWLNLYIIFLILCNLYLGGVYMTPGRLSPRSEFTPVPSHGSIFVYMIPPQNVMPARVTPAWVHPGCCTGARISLRYEISQRYHGNAKRLPVSVWNRSAGRLERVARV